ncbi:MAG: chromate efflux transporter [Betaproteobacteria bacterium]|nr:chromate efflux transporter [Betaproteobacteria bacterium]
MQANANGQPGDKTDPVSILWAFLILGCTSFGGPIAHIGYFRSEFVEKRKWLDDGAYTDLVALCNFLPGPASSQIGIALGTLKAGIPGGVAAWLGFTLPSALALLLFAYGFTAFGLSADAGWIHGLKIVAVAVVAQAVWGMGKTLCPDRLRATLAIAATLIVFAWPCAWGQILAIVLGALLGLRYLPPVTLHRPENARFLVSKRAAMTAWVLFLALLFALPVLAHLTGNQALAMFDSFYRTGSLVFGGGHVVLPLLRNEVVLPGWVDDSVFLAGYGAAQAVPGPLFTFAAYLGSVLSVTPNGILGGLLCLVAIFLPAFLLVIGALPFWDALRQQTKVQSALRGVGASVVGLLLAALYDPLWTSSIKSTRDMALALVSFALLMFWKWRPLYVVLLATIGGAVNALY